ncbi:MAG: hypothetical protein [Inoviridae sp.]|nr:MAG: hypothetical protein [Inoviridae sp.]
MKIILLQKLGIVSKKDNKPYVVFKGVSRSGEIVEFILNETDAEKFSIPNTAVLSTEILTAMFQDPSIRTLDVEFNNRGRVEKVTV